MDLAQLKKNWEILAQRDPMWAILSDPTMKGGRWDPASFFASGQAGIDDILRQVEAAKFSLRRGTALDFGCGLGRLTQGLAKHFEQTYGVDISPTMIAKANRYNQFGDACTYVLNDAPNLHQFADAMFDFIYSDAVLQHIPPDASKNYVAEFVRVLKPGGLLMFQLPSTLRATSAETAVSTPRQPSPPRSGLPGIIGRLRAFFARPEHTSRVTASNDTAAISQNTPGDSLSSDGLEKLIDMHGIPREEICELLKQQRATLLQVQAENWSGPEWLNFRYWVTK